MLELLHICPDDKFIDMAIELFNSTQCHNSYVCVKETEQSFNYIKSSHVFSVSSDDLMERCKNSNYDVFVFHTLDFSCYRYVLSIPIEKKIIWLSWGYDLYQSLGGYPAIYPIKLFKPITQRFINAEKKVCLFKRIKRTVKAFCFPVRTYKLKKETKECIQKRVEEQNEVLKRIDYISTVLPSEYCLLKENRQIRAKYFPFQYTCLNKKERTELIDFDKAQWILIGNSATVTNNHIDILDLCKRRNITNRLYIPIAYGDSLYVEEIKRAALGQDVFFQDTFLTKEDYQKRLSKCGVCVFGHLRQQALGNIVIALMQGSKVFFYKDSMVYQYLKSEGYVICSIEDDFWPSNIAEPLSYDEMIHNRKKILEWFCLDNVYKRMMKILSKI